MPRGQVTVSNSYEECEEMSLTKESKGPKHPQNNPKHKQNNHRNQADQAHVRSSLKEQKVQIRRPTQK